MNCDYWVEAYLVKGVTWKFLIKVKNEEWIVTIARTHCTNTTTHSCILRVNNWATDFCTKLQFYSTKTRKMDELWRLALISLGWYCKMWLLVKQCRKKNLESHFWPFLEKIKLPRGNFGYILSSYFIWEERCAKIF